MTTHIYRYFFYILFVLTLAACGGENSNLSTFPEGESIPLQYARNLTLTRLPGYVRADIRNPWDTLKNLHTYLLVPDSLPIPENLPEGTVVKVPLKNSLVYSTVHQSVMEELGRLEALGGIMDRPYVNHPVISQQIDEGKIIDCGTNTTPNIEKIAALHPDAIILSPFENSGGYGKMGQLGIPIIECADYMEETPLGRTEWIKFFGLLFGTEQRANEIFDKTASEYNNLKKIATGVEFRPIVLTDKLYGQTWNMPGRRSLMNILIEDAGGINPFGSMSEDSNIPLSGEQVLHKASDADIWLLRYWQQTDKNLAELAKDSPLYPQFKAYKTNNVYGCNTSEVTFYEDVPYHPQWLLADLIRVLHPEIKEVNPIHSYFTKMVP